MHLYEKPKSRVKMWNEFLIPLISACQWWKPDPHTGFFIYRNFFVLIWTSFYGMEGVGVAMPPANILQTLILFLGGDWDLSKEKHVFG